MKQIKYACDMGEWIICENLHLAPNAIPVLIEVIEGLAEYCHREFRLWLAFENSTDVLQNSGLHNYCVSVAVEPPAGCKQNILDPAHHTHAGAKLSEYDTILFLLCIECM